MENRYTKIDTETTSKVGRPKDPNAKKKATVCLRPADWETFKKWQGENEAETNYSIALERVAEFLRTFAPGGPEIKKDRDELGRWKPQGGTSGDALRRAKRRKAREEAQKEEEAEV